MVQSWIYLVKSWWRSTLALRSNVRDLCQEDSQSRCCSPLCSVLFLCLAPSLFQPASAVLSSSGLVDPPLLSLSKLNWRPSGCCWYDESLAAAKEVMWYSRSLSLINYAIALDCIFWLNGYFTDLPEEVFPGPIIYATRWSPPLAHGPVGPAAKFFWPEQV